MKDFIAAFRPQDGDLVYGRAEARGAYFNQFTAAQINDINTMNSWVTIDQYNDFFGSSGDAFFNDENPNVLKVKKHLGDKGAVANTTSPDARFQAQRQAYGTRLASSRYSPVNVLVPTVRREQKLEAEGFSEGSIVQARVIDASEALKMNMAYKSIRRSCKFGIGMVAIEAAFRAPRAKIRFVLDGLDMKSIARKDVLPGYSRSAVPITSSELRYVYRNWGDLNSIVKFYVNLAAVDPPWITDWDLPSIVAPGLPTQTLACKTYWDEYGLHRSGKYKGAVPNKTLI